MTPSDIIAAILDGALDDQMDALIATINARRRNIRQLEELQSLTQLKVGTNVKLEGISPKYLNGLTGTVDAINGKKVTVKLDLPALAGRFAYGGKVIAPASVVKVA